MLRLSSVSNGAVKGV
ncbi:hypothetical protein, partial [Escherichia coli]